MAPLTFQDPEKFAAQALAGIAAIAEVARSAANGKAIVFISVPLFSSARESAHVKAQRPSPLGPVLN
jgi:hypothetical protein